MVFDFNRVGRGELIAGGAGIALIVFMLAVHWYGIKETNLLPGPTAPGGAAEGFPRDAFESFTYLDIYLLITALAAIALPLTRASDLSIAPNFPFNLIVGGLGIVAVALIIVRLIDPPNLAFAGGGNVSDVDGASVIRKPGPWLGLIASAGIALGGLISRRPA